MQTKTATTASVTVITTTITNKTMATRNFCQMTKPRDRAADYFLLQDGKRIRSRSVSASRPCVCVLRVRAKRSLRCRFRV